ncbi:sensor histidine kinase [Aequorivita xiaoshiensis]|uniref:histidine kinase n=1 Tax=Aequorivita xiaoshiensis TaxID=2874476 RepID=A0A9X1U4Z5_9FLAO|nr:ATP-binding protein [Aequorivita xiaoshiensis]MCG2429642.1 sensor histidine kinase [Aequorivita xiaoshiensis]
MKISKKYRFAASTAFLIALFSVLGLVAFHYVLKESISGWLLLYFVILFFISYIILQYRVEKFIYLRIKKIYKDVSVLYEKDFPQPSVTTDLEGLTKEVERYVNDKKTEIESLNIRENYRKEFMGNVSHELKTPLFTVQSYILTLLDGALDDKKVRKEYLKRASKGVERLAYIVNELDLIAKLEIGGLVLKKENFNIIELVQSIFDLLEMKAAKKNISLVFDKEYKEPIIVNADKERIEQVLTNLIVNSIKYGRKEGTTEVGFDNIGKNKILLRITDNGEGILQENLKRIFERFYRVDKSGSRKEGGSGLGLSIVKHIVEAHKEKIYVESQYGIGSEFSFTLEKGK